VIAPQPSADKVAEQVRILMTARNMADAVGYLVRVADKAGLDAISRGLMRIRGKLVVISGQRGRDKKL
jgi:hypothetical protein